MADTTQITIDLLTRIRNLERTLRGLDQIKKRLQDVAQPPNARNQIASFQRQLQAQQRAVEALQRQRSAALIAEERKRQSAVESLQRQRSAALIAEDKRVQQQRAAIQRRFERDFAAESQRNQRAAESLQRQRSRALIQQFRDQEREQRRAQQSVLTLDQSLSRVGGSLRNLGLGLTSLGASLSVALTAPLTALGVLSTRNAVALDSLQRGLVAITGSADEAGRQLSRLTEIAKLPGIGFQEAIQGSIRLQAVGFSAEVAERALVQFSNAVALTGGGREELARITVQLGQLSAKGKVLAQDLKPIIEAGPAVGRALLQAFGTVNSEDIQALGLTSQQFIDQLLTQLEQLPRAAAGVRNTFDNFADAVFRASASIGEAILPVLTRLIQIAEPVIDVLVGAFRQLDPVTQTVVVAFGGLLAAAGPLLFIVGQLSTGVGGLISAFGRLHALGLLPNVEGFRLLTQVMRGNASLMAGQAATTAAAATGWIALGGAVLGAVAVLGVIGVAIASYVNKQKSAVKIAQEQIAATQAQISSLQAHVKFLDGLEDGVRRTSAEQERLAEIYAKLNTRAKIRVTGIVDESERLAVLREELERLIALRNEEQRQQGASLAASLAATAAQILQNEAQRDAVSARVRANTELAESLRESGRITEEQAAILDRLNLTGQSVTNTIKGLERENERLVRVQETLIKAAKELNGTAEEQGRALATLEKQGAGTARQFLEVAKRIGLLKGSIDNALASMARFIESQEKAAKSADIFTEALRKQNEELLKAGKSADDAAKQRNDIIKAAVSLAREATDSFDGALKTLKAFIAANPDLRAAIEKERQLAGKSFEEFIVDALGGRPTAKAQTELRNTQQQLADALLEVGEAAAAKRIAVEEAANNELLQANEAAYRLQLSSYQQYLEARSTLTSKNLDLEIEATTLAASNAREAQIRLLTAAKQAGIPATERQRRLAQAASEEEKALHAETRLVELESRRRQINLELKQILTESAIQQQKDVRQLDVEFAQLDGRIEDALNTATIEKFREELEALARSQKFLSEQLARAKKEGDKDRQVEIEAALKLNQSQIDLIELIKDQEFASNKLAAANEFVRRAKETQAELERQIAFEVEFRGLKEEDAIAKRLAGERKLADSLRVVRDLVQAEIDLLRAKGVEPPQALVEFIRDTRAAVAGLGELPFTEQFRLAEKEFNRINDERVRKIQDVERAVRNRTIAEVEGQILIRRINGQYTADLEAQLALLKQIADASGQQELQQRALDIGETVRDTKDEIAGLGTQIESASKDALRSGFTDFFNDILNRTATAKEALLNFLSSITQRINDVIAENLSKQLFESLFGGADTAGEGLIAKIRGIFRGGNSGQGAQGGIGAAITGATVEATTAGAALTTGATAAAAALTTGGVTASAALVTSLTAAAAAFSAAVIAAGAAFAASIGVGAAATSGAAAARFIGGGETGLFPAVPGGAYRFVEGGYPEAVITTDPKHAARQVGILRELIAKTRGFYGRIQIPDLAIGGIVSRETAEANLLSSINRAPSFSPRLSDAALETASAQTLMNLRITNQVNSQALVEPYLSSEAGVRHIKNIISENSNDIARRIPVRR